MRKSVKKVLSGIMAGMMILTAAPVSALAANYTPGQVIEKADLPAAKSLSPKLDVVWTAYTGKDQAFYKNGDENWITDGATVTDLSKVSVEGQTVGSDGCTLKANSKGEYFVAASFILHDTAGQFGNVQFKYEVNSALTPGVRSNPTTGWSKTAKLLAMADEAMVDANGEAYMTDNASDVNGTEQYICYGTRLVNDEVPVAAPVAFNGQTLLNHQGFYFAVFPSVGGRQFEADNIDQMEAVGRYLGRMHQTGRKQLFIHRPTIGLNEYLIEPRKLFEDATLIPSGLKAAFLKATDELIAAVTAHWREDFTVLRLHGDCHAGNILWRDGPMFVDLDDARNGPAIQDLWMLLNGDKAEQRMQLETIIEAYEEFSEFDTAEIGLIEPLRAMRLVYYLAWLMRRWADPAFPKNFPWLTGEDYWLRQTATFIEQAKVLQEPPLQLTPMY